MKQCITMANENKGDGEAILWQIQMREKVEKAYCQ